MDKYPDVMGEYETIQRILDTGCSISRFGDGEVKLMDGASQIREPANPKLAAELRTTIADTSDKLIIGIPTMDPNGPKIRNWEGRKSRTLNHLSPKVKYGSAFISRPDSAPWISTSKYAHMVKDIWNDKTVTAICEPTNKLLTVLRKTAKKLDHYEIPSHKAYDEIDKIENYVLRGRSDVIMLSGGPMASCLARRLAHKDRQAIDMGSIGGFLLKLLELEPLGDLRTVSLRRPEDMTVDEMKAKLKADWDMFYFDEKER